MGCGGTCLKVISGIFSVYFTIVGLALTAYGAFSTYTILISNSVDTIKEENILVPSAVTLACGIFLLILVFIGCCAICKEGPCCMETYATLLILLSLIQIGLGVYCLITYRENIETYFTLRVKIAQDVDNTRLNYRHDPEPMDRIQTFFQCCGTNGPDDYSLNQDFPKTCCRDESPNCYSTSFNNRFSQGCAEQVYLFIVGTNYYQGLASLVVGATELFAALLGICLSCCVWRHQNVSWS